MEIQEQVRLIQIIDQRRKYKHKLKKQSWYMQIPGPDLLIKL